MTAGQSRFPIAPSHWAFKQYGQTGTWVSDLLPYTAQMVDDLTIIKSTNTDAINHEPAIMLMNTGNMNAGKPCLGSWLAYGLGSMNDNLPTFIVLQTKTNPEGKQSAGFVAVVEQRLSCPPNMRAWGCGRAAIRCCTLPILAGVDRDVRRKMLDAVEEINRQTLAEIGRSGNQRAHCAVRDGVPDAGFSAGTCWI